MGIFLLQGDRGNDVTILYLSATGSELGRYAQVLTVGDSQVATIDNPGYENSKPDFKTLRFLAEGYYPSFTPPATSMKTGC